MVLGGLIALSTGWAVALSPRPASPFSRSRPVVAEADSLTVSHFLKDLELLGPCRFVVVGPGAILEAVGAFEELRVNDKGLATVSNDDKSFECHVRLGEVKSAVFAKKESGAKTLHIIRLLNDEKTSLLSAILHADEDGKVEEGAVEWWEALRKRFGDEVTLLPEEDGAVEV